LSYVGFLCRSPNKGAVPEMVIMELQGDLETKSLSTSLNGKFVGDLHFTKSVFLVQHTLYIIFKVLNKCNMTFFYTYSSLELTMLVVLGTVIAVTTVTSA